MSEAIPRFGRARERLVPVIGTARSGVVRGVQLATTARGVAIGFAALHTIYFVALLPTILSGGTLGDLDLYRFWAHSAVDNHNVPGIDQDWVYPFGAIVPITLPYLAGSAAYLGLWFVMLLVLDGLAVYLITRTGTKRAFSAAWWWMIAYFVLSPVSLLRLEGVAAPLVIIGLVLLAQRPAVASALIAAATWIKVWPVAVLMALFVARRDRFRIATVAVLVSILVVVAAFLTGGLSHISSFVTAQGDRSLQLEAPVTTIWLWMQAAGVPDIQNYQNWLIETREVVGPGTAQAAALMDPLMLVAVVVIVVLLAIRSYRKGATADVVLTGALAFASALIVFNKVGSPQYQLWIMPIIAVGILQGGRSWKIFGGIGIALAVLTTFIFPIAYGDLIDNKPDALLAITIRNLLVVVVMLGAIARLAGLGPMVERVLAAVRPVRADELEPVDDEVSQDA